MNAGFIVAGIAVSAAALLTAGSALTANVLFKKVIPRQDGVKVDMDEMADAQKWQEYMKIIEPNKEFMLSLPKERIEIKSRDDLTLIGDYYPAEKPSDNLVICFHGYTSQKMSNCSFASFMHKLGFDCLLVDSRSHGESEGAYIGFGILDRYDCLSWINYVDERFDKKKNILLYGVSMGASTAVMATGFDDISKSVKAVVSDCAFTSPYDVFSHILKRDYKLSQFPVMNMNNRICNKKAGYGFKDYSTLDAVVKTDIPILFIHGKNDDFVPVYMTEKNFNACNSEKELLYVENAGHGASYYENPELYEEKVKDFIGRFFTL
ncbi:MAG: alpha/beta hydrolase [Oscillospiraceae bacterium]|nr:alpha/beta hydrolase [Oscillospiraceae bacterium]